MSSSSLRPWQSEALRYWTRTGRGTVEVATGGGKTLFALACWQALCQKSGAMPIVVIVPTRALADQWYVNAIEDAGIAPDRVATLSTPVAPGDFREFNIVVLNTARNVAREVWPKEAMLVVDECHRAGTFTNSRALAGDFSATLGLSATPERQYDDGFERFVVPRIGPVIYSYSVADALRDGVLSPFELRNVEVPLTSEEQSEYDRLTARIARLSSSNEAKSAGEDIEALLRRRSRVSALAAFRVPTTVRLAEEARGERTLIFHESIRVAGEIQLALKRRGFSVAAYHSGLGEQLRRENLRLFRRGVYDMLVTCRALDEGTNVPETSVAIIAASTASTRQRIQRLGRVLRPAPGKEMAIVYTLYATEPEQTRLYSEAVNLDGLASVQWRKVVLGS